MKKLLIIALVLVAGASFNATLADKKKITSAKQNIYQMCQEEDLEFDVKPDYDASSVSITRVK